MKEKKMTTKREKQPKKPAEGKKLKVMQEKDMQKTSVAARTANVFAKIGTYLFLAAMALIVLFPFYWMIISSLKTVDEYRKPIPTMFPQTVQTNKYFVVNTDLELGSVDMVDKLPTECYSIDIKTPTPLYNHNEKNAYYIGLREGETTFGVYNASEITGENAGNFDTTRFPVHLYEVKETEGQAEFDIKFIDNPRNGRTYKLGADLGNGKILYFNGKVTADGRLDTTEDVSTAANVVLERADSTKQESGQKKGRYVYIRVEDGQTQSYIRAFHTDTGRMGYSLPTNYVDAFKTGTLGKLFMNTLYVGVVSTLLSLVITVLSAFAFARLEFKGKDTLFGALLATMMIPGELFTITNYLTVSKLGWINSFTALIVPFLVSVFYIYLLRQNFQQIPNELYLAAKVDGTSDLKYLWKVMVPLALPTLISITILKMMGAWNTYIWPNLVARNEEYHLITNGLRNAFTTVDGNVNIPVQMAAVAIVSAPLFMVFLFLRKYIMAGVSRSGIKG